MLSEKAEALWLDPLTEDPEVLQRLLVPFPPELIRGRKKGQPFGRYFRARLDTAQHR